jgi:predicted RNase H-like HicB family nuclease
MKYAVVIEKGKRNYSAYLPDVPGCVTTGKTIEEVKKNMKEALAFHFEGMILDNEAIPEPTSSCAHVSVDPARIARRARRESRVSSA